MDDTSPMHIHTGNAIPCDPAACEVDAYEEVSFGTDLRSLRIRPFGSGPRKIPSATPLHPHAYIHTYSECHLPHQWPATPYRRQSVFRSSVRMELTGSLTRDEKRDRPFLAKIRMRR
jgi:hypothetical protein